MNNLLIAFSRFRAVMSEEAVDQRALELRQLQTYIDRINQNREAEGLQPVAAMDPQALQQQMQQQQQQHQQQMQDMQQLMQQMQQQQQAKEQQQQAENKKLADMVQAMGDQLKTLALSVAGSHPPPPPQSQGVSQGPPSVGQQGPPTGTSQTQQGSPGGVSQVQQGTGGSQTGNQGSMINPSYLLGQQQGGAAANSGNATPTGTQQFQFGALDPSLTPTRSNKERTPSEIPVEKFEYGSVNADFAEWVNLFEVAVRTATNAVGQARQEELFLQWVSLKMNEAARPIFHNCPSRSTNWLQLKKELNEGFEDPDVKRRWARDPEAYMRPKGMSLQVYKAKVLSLVNKYSPWVINHPIAYQMELYTRFLNGLDKTCRDYVDEAIAYGKESIDTAYNAACKFESKQEKGEEGSFTAGAISDSRRERMRKMEHQMEEIGKRVKEQERKRDLGRPHPQERQSYGRSSHGDSGSHHSRYRSSKNQGRNRSPSSDTSSSSTTSSDDA